MAEHTAISGLQDGSKHQDSNSIEDVTVILTVWKRDHLREQIECLYNQSRKPAYIWVYQCGNFVDTQRILKKYQQIGLVRSSINLKYFGRFSLAQFTRTKYVWILDDDVIPSNNWLKMCQNKCDQENAIITSTGRIIPKNDFLPEHLDNVKDYFLGDNTSYVSYNFCKEDTVVDFGCNSWFLKSDWIRAFWQIPPHTLETAEDIHLSATCLLKLGVKTIVPKQINEETSGNMKKSYGRDSFASWMTPDFEESREGVIRYFIEQLGWKPLHWDN